MSYEPFSVNFREEAEPDAASPAGTYTTPGFAAQRGGYRLTILMVAVDLVAIAMAFLLAAVIADGLRGVVGVSPQSLPALMGQRGQEMALLACLGVGVFAFGGLYRRSAWELNEIRNVVAGVALVALFDAMMQFALRDHDSRLWFSIAYPLTAVMVIALRMGARSLPRVRVATTTHVVLIGEAVTPDLLINELRESRGGPVALLRRIDIAALRDASPHALARTLDGIAAQEGVPSDKVLTVIAPAPEGLADAQTVIERMNAARRPYSIILPFRGLARSGLHLREVIGADMVLAEMRPTAGPGPALALKRLFDIIVTAGILTLLAPMFLILLGLQALQRGPIFFTQTRVGRGDSRFTCYKLRTMRPDAETALAELLARDPQARAEWAAYQKLRNDPRVTRLGAFLRRTSLDELPQLWNVLRGDMSLVGPRPIVAPEIDGYEADRAYYESPEYTYYSRCTPGITGLWQVSGRAATTHEERVRLDRWYCRNWSFWLDMLVLFKTIGVVLARRGSH